MNKFVLTEDHLKLLENMRVGWQDCENGAPEIDPKRPYGNSDVEEDIAEILGIEFLEYSEEDEEKCLNEEQREKIEELHLETEIALQIVLVNLGDIKLGTYTKDEYQRNWKFNEGEV